LRRQAFHVIAIFDENVITFLYRNNTFGGISLNPSAAGGCANPLAADAATPWLRQA
jgi:hypothetical protein